MPLKRRLLIIRHSVTSQDTLYCGIEQNCVWGRALAGPTHLGLKTGPLCPIILYQFKGALFLYQSSRCPPYLTSQNPQGPKRRNPDKHVKNKSLKIPGKGAPFRVPQQGPYVKKCSVSRANGSFIHSFTSVGFPPPKKGGPSHEVRGKYLVTVHGTLRGRKAYIQWGPVWFLKGIVQDTAISTPGPCNLQHNTFHLGMVRPEPRQPACVVVTLDRV